MNSEGFKDTEIGFIPKNWEVRELSSLGKIITGKTPSTKEKDNFGSDYPFITPRDMKGQKFILKTERYLSEKGKNAVKNCFLPRGSICVSCIGSDMGKVVMNKRPSITNQQLNSIVIDKINPEFVYYALLNISTRLKDLAHSTAVPIINKKYFSMIKIGLPCNLTEIDNIASILSSLDAKIENNNQMNSTLEAIGQSIFRHWFVHFEFPNENGQPYKSSGGEMVDSELGEIPKEWKVLQLKDNCKAIRGFSAKYVKKSNLINLNQKVNRGGFLDKSNYKFYPEDSKIPKDKFARKKDILINSDGVGTIGRTHLFWENSKNIVIDQHITIIRPNQKDILSEYLYYHLISPETKYRIENEITGSTGMVMLNVSKIRDFLIMIPEINIQNKFSKLASIIHLKKYNNVKENQNLSQIRDSLLPKLMSGKIRVPKEAAGK